MHEFQICPDRFADHMTKLTSLLHVCVCVRDLHDGWVKEKAVHLRMTFSQLAFFLEELTSQHYPFLSRTPPRPISTTLPMLP